MVGQPRNPETAILETNVIRRKGRNSLRGRATKGNSHLGDGEEQNGLTSNGDPLKGSSVTIAPNQVASGSWLCGAPLALREAGVLSGEAPQPDVFSRSTRG